MEAEDDFNITGSRTPERKSYIQNEKESGDLPDSILKGAAEQLLQFMSSDGTNMEATLDSTEDTTINKEEFNKDTMEDEEPTENEELFDVQQESDYHNTSNDPDDGMVEQSLDVLGELLRSDEEAADDAGFDDMEGQQDVENGSVSEEREFSTEAQVAESTEHEDFEEETQEASAEVSEQDATAEISVTETTEQGESVEGTFENSADVYEQDISADSEGSSKENQSAADEGDKLENVISNTEEAEKPDQSAADPTLVTEDLNQGDKRELSKEPGSLSSITAANPKPGKLTSQIKKDVNRKSAKAAPMRAANAVEPKPSQIKKPTTEAAKRPIKQNQPQVISKPLSAVVTEPRKATAKRLNSQEPGRPKSNTESSAQQSFTEDKDAKALKKEAASSVSKQPKTATLKPTDAKNQRETIGKSTKKAVKIKDQQVHIENEINQTKETEPDSLDGNNNPAENSRNNEENEEKSIRSKSSVQSDEPFLINFDHKITQGQENQENKAKEPVKLMSNNGSMLKAAIPYLPLPVAVFCLVLNVILPGFGTIVSGFAVLCTGRPRVESKDDQIPQTVCMNFVVGICQMVTVTFMLVGWFWSLSWGIYMIILAIEYRWVIFKEKKHQEKVKLLQEQTVAAEHQIPKE